MGNFVLVTDRGGHLHNALMLLGQMDTIPHALVTTYGPDIDSLRKSSQFQNSRIASIPHLFSWMGKRRWFNPFKFVGQLVQTFFLALRLKPDTVVSVGGSNVVLFCYWAKGFGAKIYHVECMNQVVSRSITGRILYPICERLYVQWQDLLPKYGRKAVYEGWVL